MKAALAIRHVAQAGEASQNFQRIRLLARFDLCCDQADVIDTSTAHDVNRPSDLPKINRIVALHESHFLGAQLENFVEARTELSQWFRPG